jgi:large subunit ribosomal protein L33
LGIVPLQAIWEGTPHQRINQAQKMAKKGNRIQVILECTEHKASGLPGTSRYITTKNRKNTTERLELKKFNNILRRVTVHKEIK